MNKSREWKGPEKSEEYGNAVKRKRGTLEGSGGLDVQPHGGCQRQDAQRNESNSEITISRSDERPQKRAHTITNSQPLRMAQKSSGSNSRGKSKCSSSRRFNARRPSPVSPTTSRLRLTEERFALFNKTLEQLTAESLFANRDESLPVLRVIRAVNAAANTAPAFSDTEALAALWRMHDMELVLMARNGVVHRVRLARGTWGGSERRQSQEHQDGQVMSSVDGKSESVPGVKFESL
jgi:hypothetical protein